jgi:MFS family permease
MDETDLSRNKQCFALICAFCYQVCMAGNYFGFVNPYITSYFYHKGDHEITPGITSQIVSIKYLIFEMGLFLSPYLCEYLGFRPLILLGSFGYSLCYLICYLTDSFSVFFFAFAILGGLSMGIHLIMGTFALMTSFPNRKGLVTSAVLTGGVVSSIFLGNLAQYIINPHDVGPSEDVLINGHSYKYFDEVTANRLPYFFLFLCIFQMIASLTFGIGILSGSQFKGKIQIYIEEKLNDASGDEIERKMSSSIMSSNKSVLTIEKNELVKDESLVAYSSSQNIQMTKRRVIREILRTREFYVLFLCRCLTGLPGDYMAAMFKTIGLKNGLEDSFLTLMGTISLIVAVIFKFLSGFLLDKIGFKRPWQMIQLIAMLSMVGMITFSYFPASFLVVNAMAAVNAGCVIAVYTASCQIAYGKIKGPVVYSFMSLSMPFNSLILSTIFLLQESLGFSLIFVILFGISSLAFLIMSLAREKRYK